MISRSSASSMLALVGVVAIMGGGLSACGAGNEPGTGALAIVVGGHANSPKPVLSSQLRSLIDTAGQNGSYVTVTTSEGMPKVAAHGSLTVDAKNQQARDRKRLEMENALLQGAESVKAATPENDLLGAIALAGRSIAEQPGEKTLVVVDNGLQTTDPLKFQADGMLESDPAEVVDYLKHTDELPDLKRMKVILSGIGDVSVPQKTLTLAQHQNLVDLWQAVMTAAGASVQIDKTPLSGTASIGLPKVTTVDVSTDGYVAQPIKPKQTVTVALTQDKVAFRPDSSAFVDAAAADETLRPLAEQIKSQHLTVHLIGSTSSAGTAAGRKTLSTSRAKAVLDRLVSLGVEAGQVTSEGVGSDWSGYISDKSADGQLLPGPAAQNRKVTVQLSAG